MLFQFCDFLRSDFGIFVGEAAGGLCLWQVVYVAVEVYPHWLESGRLFWEGGAEDGGELTEHVHVFLSYGSIYVEDVLNVRKRNVRFILRYDFGYPLLVGPYASELALDLVVGGVHGIAVGW